MPSPYPKTSVLLKLIQLFHQELFFQKVIYMRLRTDGWEKQTNKQKLKQTNQINKKLNYRKLTHSPTHPKPRITSHDFISQSHRWYRHRLLSTLTSPTMSPLYPTRSAEHVSSSLLFLSGKAYVYPLQHISHAVCLTHLYKLFTAV